MSQTDPDKHRFAVDLRSRYDPVLWDSYFKFAFVRNPWDRLVSWWAMIARNAALAAEGRRSVNGFQRFVLSRARNFEEFVRNCDEEFHDVDGSKWIFRNQLDYIADADGVPLVQYIGRFERLQTDFAAIASQLGLEPIEIPRLNSSPRSSYTDYYTPALADTVGERYERDLAAFGYRYGDP